MASTDGFVKPNAPVRVAFAPDVSGQAGRFGEFKVAELHTDTAGAPAYLTTTTRFASPGTYWVRATYLGDSSDAPLSVGDADAAAAVAPGQPMVAVKTPTPADHAGVEPICTRTPECPWHAVSLDDALYATEKRPLVVLFATPKLCQTATCGPTLDTLLGLRSQFEDKVRFVHSEIYADGSGNDPNPQNAPAVVAYKLPGEPVLYLAGADGVVRERIDGLFGTGEAAAALGRLVAS
jgi:hypothetical protein